MIEIGLKYTSELTVTDAVTAVAVRLLAAMRLDTRICEIFSIKNVHYLQFCFIERFFFSK